MNRMRYLLSAVLVLIIMASPVSDWTSVQKISTHPDNITREDRNPQIGVDSFSNSYVTWWGHDGNDYEIYWVKVDASGIPGTAQKISTHPDNATRNDFLPQIGVHSSGNSYVTWRGSDGDEEIYWVKITASGVPGTVQKISTHPDNLNRDDYLPQIGVDSFSNSYVTWQGHDGNDYEIYWVKITASGVPGTVQKISTHPDNITREDREPEIAVDSSGNSYVTWQGFDGNDYEIYWVKINTFGVPGTVQKISTHPNNTAGDDYQPHIAVDSSGNSYVVWNGYDGFGSEIYWVKITASGVPGTIQKFSVTIVYHDLEPQLAVSPSGDSYITWYSFDEQDTEIYWVKITASGVPGTIQEISTHPDNATGEDVHPQITADSSGNSFVTWQGFDGNDYEIYWVKVDASGVPGTVEKISTHPDNITRTDWDPQIELDPSGNSHVTWCGFDGTDPEIYQTSDLPEPVPTLGSLADFFDSNSFMVAGNQAYCTDVLGSAKIAWALGEEGTQDLEGRTDTLLTQQEHDTGNLIPVGGPAVNPLATEFGDTFEITYEYNPGVSFELFCEGESIFLDLTSPLNEDICIIYLGEENSRYVLLVWGFEWEGTYAGSAFLGDPSNWQAYQTAHLLMLRWIDSNSDGLVQMSEITVEVYK